MKILKLGLIWVTSYVLIMFAMCVDNIFWIRASPEYPEYKKWSARKRLAYIFNYRIKTVLTHPLDIIPAIITSTILTGCIYGFIKLLN